MIQRDEVGLQNAPKGHEVQMNSRQREQVEQKTEERGILFLFLELNRPQLTKIAYFQNGRCSLPPSQMAKGFTCPQVNAARRDGDM